MDSSHTYSRAILALLIVASLTAVLIVTSSQEYPVSALPANDSAAGRAEFSQVDTDQIIVKYSNAVDLAAMSQDEQDSLLRRMSAVAGVELEFVRPMSGGAYVFRLPERTPADEISAVNSELTAMPQISLAEADRILQAIGRYDMPPAALDKVQKIPDDPRFADQWHYRYTPGKDEGINLPQAWDVTTGNSSTVVAVIDTGITDHVEFKGRTVPGYDFMSNSLMANDGDGRDPDPSDPGDWEPSNTCYPGSPSYDSSWHGTHVAGTIAASSNNGIGVSGVNWKAKILPVRALGRCGGYTSDIVDGARWAAGLAVPGVPKNSNPAAVMNLSLGGSGPCSAAEQAAYNDIVAAGTVVVVSAGNSNANASDFSPANCAKVITVAATDRTGDKADYSNYGSTIEISAPGGEGGENGVLSTLNSGTTVPKNDSYAYYRGTSMAAPHVAGVVSLLMGHNPGMTPAQALARIEDSARAFPSGSSCNTNRCGAGIVDAAAAIGSGSETLGEPVIGEIANPDGDGNFSVEWGAVDGAEWYKVKENRSGTTWEPVYEGPATLLARENLAKGEYCYRVRAFNSNTFSDWSSDKCAVVDSGEGPTETPTPTNTPVPDAIEAPVLSDIENPDGDGSFNVEWAAVGGAEWYKVKENRNGATWEPVYEGTATLFQRDNLAKGEYCYRVRAFNSATNSDWSADKCTVVGSGAEPTKTPTLTPTGTPSPTPSSTPTSTPGSEKTRPAPLFDYSLFVPLVRTAD